MIATILAGILLAYSLVKSVYLMKRKSEESVFGYDTSGLSDKDKREFSNLITNTLTNLTFFYGTIVYVVNIYTDYGIITGIGLLILVIIQDYYFTKSLFPREYNKIRGN